ncbi:MAG TPA: hypothetical protein O0W81_00985 [Methanocorpusculum sp.]|nr:hypothetical protein [Methanocorpusculum sp.]
MAKHALANLVQLWGETTRKKAINPTNFIVVSYVAGIGREIMLLSCREFCSV